MYVSQGSYNDGNVHRRTRFVIILDVFIFKFID